jgi:polyhydroxybutyrate depolymerase
MIRQSRFSATVAIFPFIAAACTSKSDNPPQTAEEPDAAESAPATTEPDSSPGCYAEGVASAGTSERSMMSGGEERFYQLIIPDSYDGTAAFPVVFGLHGLSIDYRMIPSMSGFTEMAQKYDFIGVSPSGLLDENTPYWVAAPVYPNRDVAYISDLLDLLEAELCIDARRVFSTGMSNGGQMSSLLACQLSDRITAVAPIAGVEWSEVCDGGPVPVLAFHGDADTIVTYEGGGLNAAVIADIHHWKGDLPDGLPEHGGVDTAMANWADHNGCDPEPVEKEISSEVIRYTWKNCDAETILYRIIGGGHTWPGKPVPAFEEMFGHTTTDIDATDLIFEFFFAS